MQSLTQPTLLLKPFADEGDRNSIPVENTDAQNPQLADLTNGFPQVTSEDPDDGGLPPERKDINGLGYLTTTYDYFYQAGGTFTFNPTISTAIGGYPLGARLWYTDSNGATTVVRSTVANNTDNFNDGSATGIGTTWAPEIPALGWNNVWTGTNKFVGQPNKVVSNYTKGVVPVSNIDVSFGFEDSNGSWLGGFEQAILSNGYIFKRIVQVNPNGEGATYLDLGYATDGSEYVGASNGVKSSIIGWVMPNLNAGVSAANYYTVPKNGWVYWRCGSTGGILYINNVLVCGSGVYTDQPTAFVPVSKGDVVSYTSLESCIFYPCIGG